MSMTASKARLEALTKDLSSRWKQTKDFWQDAKRREFEQRFMDELIASVNRTTASIDELDKVVTKVRNECG